jgi:hypothetical protein
VTDCLYLAAWCGSNPTTPRRGHLMTEPQAGTETTEGTQQQTPPWGSDDQYDPAKAWSLIEGLRADKEKLSSRPALTVEQQQKLDEYERLVQASKSELERQTEEVTRWQSDAERWRTAAVTSRVEALAGQDFADPSDAATALTDPGKYLDAGGVIDETAIRRDLAALLERKPHWRRTDATPVPRVPAPNRAQGSGTDGKATADPAAEFAAFMQGQLHRS